MEPTRFDALVFRGAIAAERGDRKKAISILEKAISVEPDSALPRFALGAFHVLRGEWQKARPHLEAALEREETPQSHFFLGQIKSETGDVAGAIEHFRHVLKHDPAHEDALFHLGLCYLERNWTQRAHDCFERALALNPTRIEYQQANELVRTSGGAAQALGREAAALYREAEKRAAAGNLGESYSLLRRARLADPESPALAVAHALVASSLGRTAEAISSAREAIRKKPAELVMIAAYVALLEALRSDGRHAEAVRTADEMLRTCDSQYAGAMAHYERAMSIADSGDEGWISEALRSASVALRQAPRELRHFALEALGWAHYRGGEFETAVGYLERAASAFPSRSTLTHFGTALLASGDRTKARDILRRAGRAQVGSLRIEDRFREQVRRQVRLDESANHDTKSAADGDTIAGPVRRRPASGGTGRARKAATESALEPARPGKPVRPAKPRS